MWKLYFLLLYILQDYCVAKSLERQKSYDGYKLFRVFPETQSHLAYLDDLWQNDTALLLDFWTAPRNLNKTVDVMVPPASIEGFITGLTRRRMNVTTLMTNVQSGIELEKETLKYAQSYLRDSASAGNSKGHRSFRLDIYHSYEDMQEFMRQLARDKADIVELINLRDSSRRAVTTQMGRRITMVKIGKAKPRNANKPAFWIDGGIHAREWVAIAVPIYIINELVTNYGKDERITQYVDEIDFYILPVVNPDGYEYSRNVDRMWRKNLNPNNGQRFSWCRGVDLNRNFDWWFGGEGSSADPCRETFRGERAFSEPESLGIKEMVETIKGRLEAYVTLHSYSQIWMYPYGHKRNARAPDWRELSDVARRATDQLRSLYGTKYTSDTGANALYPAAGGSDDWAKGTIGVKYTYLIELRPEDEINIRQVNYGFMLPPGQIIPTSVETWAGLKVVVDAVLERIHIALAGSSRSVICEDRESYCTWWSSNGDCENHKSYMMDHCAKACKLCSKDNTRQPDRRPLDKADCFDRRKDCEYWTENSLCSWVKKGCARSCRTC